MAKSYVTEIVNHIEDIFEEFDSDEGKEKLEVLRGKLKSYNDDNELIMNSFGRKFIAESIKELIPDVSDKQIRRIFTKVNRTVDKLTYQAMEAVIHNLNTMQSRAG